MADQQHIENIRRRLTRLMLLSIIITLSLLASILAILIYKLSHNSQPYKAQQIIELPVGAQIISQSLSANNIALHIKTGDHKESIILYDYKNAKIISHLTLQAAI